MSFRALKRPATRKQKEASRPKVKKKASKDAARRFFQPEIKAQEQSSSSDMKKNVLFLG